MHSQAVLSALTRLGTHHTGLITAEDQALGRTGSLLLGRASAPAVGCTGVGEGVGDTRRPATGAVAGILGMLLWLLLEDMGEILSPLRVVCPPYLRGPYL